MNIKNLNIELSEDIRYMRLLKECYKYSKKSNHPSTHNAALLVKKNKIILRGANVFPPGVKQKRSRFKGKNKHIYPNHAERDVICKAAKKGIRTNNLIMVMPWLPCISCANAIISAGIKKLIVHKQMIERTRKGWINELKKAVEIMREAEIKIIAYDGFLNIRAYMHRKEWSA